jgi:hypothetical protein
MIPHDVPNFVGRRQIGPPQKWPPAPKCGEASPINRNSSFLRRLTPNLHPSIRQNGVQPQWLHCHFLDLTGFVGDLSMYVPAVIESLINKDVKEATSKYKYPPGPRGVPILGVAPLIPPVNPGPTVSKWAEQYGEMMTLQLGGTRWVFLNSSRVAREILERRSGVGTTKKRAH